MGADLIATGLSCARGGLPVIEGVGFAVPAGRALILRGPNGSGKTTLLRTLAGLQPPLAGDISARPDDVAYAGHADAVKTTFTVEENLRFWAAIHGTGNVDAAMSGFDLAPLRRRMAMHLSAGQRRRLGLARLSLTGRKIWALDEPTVSLDAESVGRFARIVEGHLAAGGIAVIATHVDLGIRAGVLDVDQFASHAPVDRFEADFA